MGAPTEPNNIMWMDSIDFLVSNITEY